MYHFRMGGNAEPKLVYVHEGRKQVGKNRWKLINARYFSGVYANSDELWVEVSDYIDKAYDMDSIEKIYLSGDGAAWIKNGLRLDKGKHLCTGPLSLIKVCNTSYSAYGIHHINHVGLYKCRDKDSVKELFKAIISTTEPETKKRAVQEARRYILGNWKGIMRQYDVGLCWLQCRRSC